jgi:hypothetical protein
VTSNCVDCGVDTCPPLEKRNGRSVRNSRNGRWEHYMVLPEIWKAAGMGAGDGYLCIGCLEKRIRRKLKPKDFTGAPINELDSWDTRRLVMRKLGLSEAELKALRAKLGLS